MKYLLSFLLLGFCFFAQAQEQAEPKVNIDERLYEVYDSDYLGRIQSAQPVLIQRWNFYLDNAWFITEHTAEKSAVFPEISIEDIDDFNIIKLIETQKLDRQMNSPTTYRIKGTTKLLVLRSEKQFAKLFNEATNRTY